LLILSASEKSQLEVKLDKDLLLLVSMPELLVLSISSEDVENFYFKKVTNHLLYILEVPICMKTTKP